MIDSPVVPHNQDQPIPETAVTLLAELVRASSEQAELVTQTVLREAFAAAWPMQSAPNMTDMTNPEENPTESAPVQDISDSQDSENIPESLSRRHLFTFLFQSPEEGEEEEGEESPKLPVPPLPDFDATLAVALSAHPDLAVITVDGEPAYHSLPLLSAGYAAILACKHDHALLIAETVRASSRDYPRPVPVEMFEYPPFDCNAEQIQAGLQTLAADPRWADIRFVESSVGTVYLYSSLYIDHDYAAFLADRQDVGMIMNP